MINIILPAAVILIALMAYVINKATRDLLSVLLLIIFFLPFERIPSVEVGGFTLKINHLLGLILILFWLLERLYRKKIFAKNPIAWPLLIFTATMVISVIVAPLKSRALEFLAINIFTILLCVATNDIIRTKLDLEKVKKVVVASSWVVLIFSVWQFLGDIAGLPNIITGLIPGYSKITFGFPRIQAFSKEPLYLGNYLLLPISFGVAKLLTIKKYVLKDWFWLLGLVMVFFLTLSRGALLGLFTFALVICMFYPKKILTAKTITIATITLVIAFLVILAGINALGPNTKDKFLGHLEVKDLGSSESTVSRLTDGQRAIDDWKDHPYFGVGLGNFGGSKTNYDPSDAKTQDIVNNEYLELLAETGIFGLGSFVILLAVIISRSIYALRLSRQAVTENSVLVASLTAGLVGILTQYAFFSTLAIIHIWIIIGLLVAIQTIVISEVKSEKI